MGQFVRCATLSGRRVPRRHRAQRRHAVLDAWLDLSQGALRPRRSRTERSLLPVPDAGRLDRGLPGPGQTHHRHQGPDVRHHRPRLEGHAARGRHGATSHPPTWSGSSAASTAPARRRTTRPSTPCRTSISWCRSVAYGKPYTPPAGKVDSGIDTKTPVREQVNRLTAGEYFTLLAAADEGQSAGAADALMAGQDGEDRHRPWPGLRHQQGSTLPLPGLHERPEGRRRKDHGPFQDVPAPIENGWVFSTKTGLYGTDYLQRALITAIGLGANRPQDAVYPTSEGSADGKPYDGANKLRDALRPGRDATGQRLLVADHVRRRLLLRCRTRSTATP